jgi:hypothetical protein
LLELPSAAMTSLFSQNLGHYCEPEGAYTQRVR